MIDPHPWNILLIEDDEDDYLLTRGFLALTKGDQFSITWVSNYSDGLDAVLKDDYDVVLVDYRLGSESGLDLVREATANSLPAPMIMLTGHDSYETDLEAMQSGAVDYLIKGQINPSLLERTIRYAIERRQAQDALKKAHDELEQRVQERTRELAQANQNLRAEIAERTKAEAAVRESETKFRKLAETTSTAIFIVQDMWIRYANPAATFITGYESDELIQKPFWDIAHPTYQAILKEHGIGGQWSDLLASDLAGQVPSRYELKILSKTGAERWIDVSAGSIEYEGEPAWVVTAFDITERDLAEQALRAVNEQLEQAKSALELRVAERTSELQSSNSALAETNLRLKVELEERARVMAEREELLAQVDRERQRVEHLLEVNQQQNQLLQTIFEIEPDGIAVLEEPELRYQYANPAYQALTPSPGTGLIGRTFLEVWPVVELEAVQAILKSVLETEKAVYGTHFQLQAPDGSTRNFSFHASPLHWKDQPAVLMVMWETTRVMEDQRRAEEAAQELRRQAEELDAVFTAMADALLIYDVEGNPLLCNPAAIQLLGIEETAKHHHQLARDLSLEYPNGKPILPDMLPAARALKGEIVKGERVAFTGADGTRHVILASASPLFTGKDQWGALMMWHDVSDRENLLGELASEQARLKTIIDNAPEGIVVADRYSRVVLANPAAAKILARPVPFGEEFQSHSFLELYHLDGTPYDLSQHPLIRSALDGEVFRNHEVLIFWPDSQRRSLLLNSSPILDRNGNITGAVIVFQDITERKIESEKTLVNLAQIEVQRRLMQQREKERLRIAQELHDDTLQDLIGLSFTLNEAVMMTSSFLERQAIQSAEGESLLSKLNVIRVLLEQQIQDIRDFCSELRPPTLAPFGLEKAIRSSLAVLKQKHPELLLEAELMPDRMVLPEETRLALYRIFQELMNNIIRHSQASRAAVFFTLTPSTAELTVQDNGQGFKIPESWLDLARQGHLGLVGARERAESVGGEFKVSTAPDKGTTVRVIVPVNRSPEPTTVQT